MGELGYEWLGWGMVIVGATGLLAVLVIEGVKGRRSPSIYWGEKR